MKATKKRSVYVYDVYIRRRDVSVLVNGEDSIVKGMGIPLFQQTLSYDPSNEVALLLNVKPAAKPAKEGKKQ